MNLTTIRNKVIKGIKAQDTYGKYLSLAQISHRQKEVMYDIYKQYYHNTNFELFLSDFNEKDGAILVFESKSNTIVGFSTVVLNNFDYQGKKYRFIFSGDTVILKEFWGSRALQSTMFKLKVKIRLMYPLEEVYWMLISKGYKTYLLLANNYEVYYPNVDGEHRNLAPIVEEYCKRFYAKFYDNRSGLLNFGEDYQPLKQDIAPITAEMKAKNPKIGFFERMNPTWIKGTELPCVGRFGWKDIARYPVHYLSKQTSVGKFEAIRHRKATFKKLESNV